MIIFTTINAIKSTDTPAEKFQRATLPPRDQFRAFFARREKGQFEEAIAAEFFVVPRVVMQRPRLGLVVFKCYQNHPVAAYCRTASTRTE